MVIGHTALIVEDDQEMADELADLVRSLGHCYLHAETLTDARACLEQGGFCYVLLDLQIKTDSQSIKPRVECGMSFLREVRERYPVGGRHGKHLMPVIVISAHGKRPLDIIGTFRRGIDDFIVKPLSAQGQDVIGLIGQTLEKAGRAEHSQCEKMTEQATRQYSRAATKSNFWHLPDYSQVSLNGELYLFHGEIQRLVISQLHQAAIAGQPWVRGTKVLKQAGSNDISLRMVNLFAEHPAWGKLLISDTRGLYSLKIE